VIAYCGQTREPGLVAELEAIGIGECTQRGELPSRRTRWFYDNHAFADWRVGKSFNIVRWERDQWRIRDRKLRPDFGVIPDVVADGEASLAWSATWRPFAAPGVPAYLVVQNGMTTDRVDAWLDEQPDPYHGIFVGSTLEWKLDTGAAWVTFAHERGMRAHIGRCGPPDRVRWARAIGADSIDSCLPLRARHHMDAFLDALGIERRAA
jgi:hypothetical protein